MTRTLAVVCPRWPVVAADLPPATPAAVFFANRAVSVSPEAAGFGVRKGMRRRDAQSRCPELEVVIHDPAAEARAFEPIVSVVESFSPKVEIVKPGVCVLPARGPARYFGGEDALREQMAATVDEAVLRSRSHPLHTDDRCRVGVADGPFAATLAATPGVVVKRGSSRTFLASFGVGVLDNPGLTDLLVRLGIRTLGDLAGIDREKVVARFGAEGEMAHRLACGSDRLLEPRNPPPDLEVTRELDPPAHRVDVAMFAGKAAADELAVRLGELGGQCEKIDITVETEHGEERTRTWRYSSALTPLAIAERVRWQLEGWLATGSGISGGISLLRLSPRDVGPSGSRPVGLWSRRGDVSDRVRRAVARVQGLVGPGGARQAAIQGGRHPSSQVHSVPWGEPAEAMRAGKETPPWPGRLPPPSPALLDVRPAEVTDARGKVVTVSARSAISASPAQIHMGGLRKRVVAWAGPWPADERWWTPDHRRRARFQIVLDDGSAHLLSLEGGRWSVEATYD